MTSDNAKLFLYGGAIISGIIFLAPDTRTFTAWVFIIFGVSGIYNLITKSDEQ